MMCKYANLNNILYLKFGYEINRVKIFSCIQFYQTIIVELYSRQTNNGLIKLFGIYE